MNEDRNLRQRAWYYSRIYADTKDEDMVYVMNVDYHKSKDGGKTFTSYDAQHGDHHDLWIAPEDNLRMIIADDGGGQVSFDAGENWSTYGNQPTAQHYRVVTDNHFPYRIYGAQQDNSTQRIAHRTDGYSIGDRDWEPTAGGESGHIAIDPTDNDIVYGGSYDGFLTRKNHRTGEERNINAWPDNPMGHGAEGAVRGGRRGAGVGGGGGVRRPRRRGERHRRPPRRRRGAGAAGPAGGVRRGRTVQADEDRAGGGGGGGGRVASGGVPPADGRVRRPVRAAGPPARTRPRSGAE